MTNLQSEDAFVAQMFAGKDYDILFDSDNQTATATTLYTNQALTLSMHGWSYVFPSLPAGITAYIITGATSYSSTQSVIKIFKAIHLGKLDISGASGTYTQDATMPTLTEGNNSNQTWSAVYVSVNTTLNASPGSFTITYTNQAGTTNVTSPSQGLTPSAAANTATATAGLLPLATGDCGVSAITAAARTAGTSPTGILDFWGMLPIGVMAARFGNNPSIKGFHLANPMRLGAGDTLKVLSIGVFATRRNIAAFRTVGDT